ncbi:MAG: M20/M25/M40 family metallo-hydrolase [Christensenellales bacterium]
MIGYTVLVLILAGLGWLIWRAVQFKPREALPVGQPRAIGVPEMPVAIKLSELVKLRTVSHADPALEDGAQFTAFQSRLHALFPGVAAHCPREIVAGKGIVYCWQGKASGDPRVLMAHYDVVPANPETWTRPPFSGDIAEGFVHGRGTLDTKCTLVACMEAAESLIAEGFVPQQDVYFCFSGDEETGGPTAQAILDALKASGVRPGFVLDEGGGVSREALPGVSLPCALVGVCEKGMTQLLVTAKDRPGHGSTPPRHTALGRLSRAILKLERRPWPLRLTPTLRQQVDTLGRHSHPLYRLVYANLKLLRPLLSVLCWWQGGELNAMLRTTCAFTMATGSKAINVLPGEVSAGANVRIIPGESIKSVRRRAARLLHERHLSVQVLGGDEPSPVSRTDDAKWAALCDAIQEIWPEALVSPNMMLGATDATHYSRVSENVYRFSGREVTRAQSALIHGNDERIGTGQLAKMVAFYQALMIRL